MEARVSESEDGIVEFDGSYGIFGVGECETEFEEVKDRVSEVKEEVKDRDSEVKAEGSSSLNGGIRPEEVRISTELGGGEIEGKAENRSNGGSVGFSELGSNRIKKKLEDSVSDQKPKAKEKSHFSGGGNGNFDGGSDGKETRVSYGGKKSEMEVVEGQLSGDSNSSYSVLHDVSTSETSEMVLQAAKGLNYRFETGDMVWGKVKSHPWWPGHIYNEALASSSVRRSRSEGHLLVAFFGDSSYGWFDLAELVPFEPNFAEKSHQTNSRTFVKAVDEAVDELCRRVALGLACRCRNRFNFRPSNVQGYFAVDVFDYEPGGVYSGKQIEKARDSFLPAETLSFVQQVALIPRGGDHSSIDWIKNVALVLAYRKAVFEEFDETYAQAFGIEPVRPSRNEFGELEQPDRVPARAPLSGPLVFAETLGVRKTGNSLRAKDSSKKDKYLFKRRDERVAKQGLNHAGQLQANVVPSLAFKEASGRFPSLAGDYVLQKRAPVIPERHPILMNQEERAIITQECGAPVTKLGSVESHGWVASPTLLSVDVPMRGGSEEGKLPMDSGHKERDAVLQISGRMKQDEIVRATSITTDSGKLESHGTVDSVGRAVGQEMEAAFVEDGHEPDQVMVDSGVRSLSVSAGGSNVGKDLGRPSGNAVVGKTTKAHKRPVGEDLSSEKHFLGEKKKRKKGEDLSSEKHILGEKKKKKDPGLETSPDRQHKKPKIVKDREALRKLAGKSIGIGSASQEHLQMGSERKDGTSSDSASMFAELDIINMDLELPQLVNDLLALALDPFHAIEHNSTAINSPAIVRHVFLKFRSLVYQKSLVLAKASESVLSNPGAAKSFAGRLLAGSSTETAELTSSVGGRETPASKPLKHPSRVEDPTIMGRKRSPSDRQEEMSAKRSKKLNKLKQLSSEKKASSRKTPDGQKGEQKETGAPAPPPAPVTAKPRQTDPAKKPELPPSETKPTALVMKFPPKTTLPSAPQLKARFARFGPLDLSGIRVFWRSSTCKVVFKYNSDAQTAYNHALQNNSLFGQVRVRYYLRELELPAPELPEANKGQADDSPNNAAPSRPSGSDIVGEPRPLVHQQRQTAVQLKSCLKKPSGDEAGTALGIAKEIPRVKFLLGGEDSRGEQMQMVTSNINSNNSISGDGASSSSSMTFNVNLKNIKASTIPPQHLLLPPNNSHFRPLWPRPPLPFVHQPSRTPDVLPPTTMPSALLPPPPFSNAPSDGHESHVPFSKAPHQMALHAHYKEVDGRKESMVDISHQMLSLLMRCSDIVTNLKSALGYVPYHTL